MQKLKSICFLFVLMFALVFSVPGASASMNPPPASIVATVLNEQGKPMQNIAVMLRSSDAEMVTITATDKNGAATFGGLWSQNGYSVIVSLDGYERLEVPLAVVAGQPRMESLRLVKEKRVRRDDIAWAH